MTEKWKSFFKNKNNLLIIVLVGILFLVIKIPVEEKEPSLVKQEGASSEVSEQMDSDSGEDLQEYCTYLEEKLEKILTKIDGAGQVEVMISMRSSAEKVVEKDSSVTRSGTEETDSQGGSRSISNFDSGESTVYDSEGSNSQPYVVKVLLPEVEGVMVLAEGAGMGTVSKNISDALQALFGIEAHKIKVVKMETP